MIHFYFYRVWTHCAQNCVWEGDNDILRHHGYSFDATVSFQHRRHNGKLVPVSVLAYLLLRLYAASQAQPLCTPSHAQFPFHCTNAWVNLLCIFWQPFHTVVGWLKETLVLQIINLVVLYIWGSYLQLLYNF